MIKEKEKKIANVVSAFEYIQKQIAEGSYSVSFVNDLNDTSKQFLDFLKKNKIGQLKINETKTEYM